MYVHSIASSYCVPVTDAVAALLADEPDQMVTLYSDERSMRPRSSVLSMFSFTEDYGQNPYDLSKYVDRVSQARPFVHTVSKVPSSADHSGTHHCPDAFVPGAGAAALCQARREAVARHGREGRVQGYHHQEGLAQFLD